MEKKQSRKRLRPWLENHCNQNTFRGLKWLDQEKRIFSISWKHQSNRGWDTSDAEIFKAWAIFTGKHNEGDPENPPEWKTRLRTALTKLSDIEEVKSMHRLGDSENPYKAYRFLDEVGNNKSTSQGSVSDSGSPTSFQASPASQADILELSDSEMDGAKNIDEQGFYGMATNIPTVVFDRGGNPHSNSMNNMDCSTMDTNLSHFNNLSSDRNGPHSGPVSDTSNMPADYLNMRAPETQSAIPSDLEQIDSDNLMHIKLPENLSIGSSLPSCEPLSPSFIGSLNYPVLKIKVYFVDECVLEGTIEDKARLFCGDLTKQCHAHVEDRIFGSMTLKQIPIPEIDSLTSQNDLNEKQKVLIRKIQKHMGRGLFLGGNDNYVFAQRLCKARVFVWTKENKNKRLDRESNSPECVFDLEFFKKQLESYIQNSDSQSQPSPHIMFSFGQEYVPVIPYGNRILLYVKVTHIGAEHLLKQVMDAQNPEDSEVMISKSTSCDYVADRVQNMRI